MGQGGSGLPRRVKIGLALTALCISMLGVSGCSWDEGYITGDGKRLGEWTNADAGILVVLYRSTGGRSYNVASSEAILALYKNYRRTRSMQDSAILTLRFLRRYCNDGGNPAENYARDRCLDALGDDEWSDFRADSLVPIDHTPGACIAVHIRSGENWTIRTRGDRHCTPN